VAFPTTSVLDTFDRADVGPPPSASWSADTVTGPSGLKVVGNLVAVSQANGFDYWNVATYGPDSEVFLDVTTKPGNGNYFAVYLRFDPVGHNGYEAELDVAAGTDTTGIWREDNAVFTQLGASISQEFAAGDALGLEMVGSTLQAYRRSSGVWSALGTTRTDATYAVAGRLAAQFGDTIARGNDFGGGTQAGGPGYLLEDASGFYLLESGGVLLLE
jgi:hypothetical protein